MRVLLATKQNGFADVEQEIEVSSNYPAPIVGMDTEWYSYKYHIVDEKIKIRNGIFDILPF